MTSVPNAPKRLTARERQLAIDYAVGLMHPEFDRLSNLRGSDRTDPLDDIRWKLIRMDRRELSAMDDDGLRRAILERMQAKEAIADALEHGEERAAKEQLRKRQSEVAQHRRRRQDDDSNATIRGILKSSDSPARKRAQLLALGLAGNSLRGRLYRIRKQLGASRVAG